MNELLGNDVRPGQIIKSVMCYDIYKPLLDQFSALGFQQNGTVKRFYPFPYDWRKDLEDTAKLLAAQFDQVDKDGADEIYLVAHSMGGLVSRLMLETGSYANRPWFLKIQTFIALATPHQGAPLALARALGLDSTLGISTDDFRKLMGDPRYPAGYQLLPSPNEAACWSQNYVDNRALDIYDTAIANSLGLNTQLIARARFVHDSLAQGKAPKHIRYFYFAGTGHETVTRVNVYEYNGTFPREDMVVTRTEAAGDGTVPLWSALPRAVQKQVVINEHAKVFRGEAFKRVFYRLLGGDIGVPFQARQDDFTNQPNLLRLSMSTPIICVWQSNEQSNEQYFELLLIPTYPTDAINGTLLLQGLREDGQPISNEVISNMSYTGPKVSHLRLLMPALASPGLYQLVFEGVPEQEEPLKFAVVSLPQHHGRLHDHGD